MKIFDVVRDASTLGHSKLRKVPFVVGPSNCGKSTVFSPLREIFSPSEILTTPNSSGSYPLAGWLRGKRRVGFFDEFNPCSLHEAAVAGKSSIASGFHKNDQRLFLEGQGFTVPVPKGSRAEDQHFHFTGPIVATG